MITRRTTRLVRAADLRAFREVIVSLARAGAPLSARDRLIVVPTRAAAAHLLRTLERHTLQTAEAVMLPDLVTSRELVARLAERLPLEQPTLGDAEREVLLGVACRNVQERGVHPPFRLRPALTAEMLRLYDALRRHQNDVDTFERRALGILEPGAASDRGAERLVRQTHFLVAAFRDFEARCAAIGLDEHAMRIRLISTSAPRPCRHIVLAVGDAAFDPHGLMPADWDLLTRIPDLERLDVVVTDTRLAGASHERIHQMLPGIEETRVEASGPSYPRLAIPVSGARAYRMRDREEEVATFARRVRQAARRNEVARLDGVALVVHQPLPYVYIAREVLRSGGIPCQLFDTLPLAAEPYAAALDLIFSVVAARFARRPALELLRSAHFRFTASSAAATPPVGADPAGGPRHALAPRDLSELDRALAEAGFLGDMETLDRLMVAWSAAGQTARQARAHRAAAVLLEIARELAPLRSAAPVADHLNLMLAFLQRHERLPASDHPSRARQLRARSAILGTLVSLGEAYRRFDDTPVVFEEVTALVRRWLESRTFAPRSGESGVHLVDAAAAPFGEFDHAHLAGLVDGEWPDRPRRNIFYSPAVLRELGWPSETQRLEGARAAFVDLLRLPAQTVALSTFALELDALVSPSPLIDDASVAALEPSEEPLPVVRMFEHEALALDPVSLVPLGDIARGWAELRLDAPPPDDRRFGGFTAGHRANAWSLSALERYQDCAFRFFAADVLRLEDTLDDELSGSPRQHGRLVHEVFQRFFEAWDARGRGSITADRLPEARELCAEVAEPLLARLPEPERALERTWLFGSAIALGLAEIVLGLEAGRQGNVLERLIEYRFEGTFSLRADDAGGVPLRGVADRIDLLPGRRLRVIDYKTGYAPSVKRALQVPIYALCAQERLSDRDGVPWAVDEATYIAFGGRRTVVPVVKSGARDADATLDDARARLFGVLAAVERGEFPPRPYDPLICRTCAYGSVCRKDGVADA